MARFWIVAFAVTAAGCGVLGAEGDLEAIVDGIEDDRDWIAVPLSAAVDVTPATGRTLVLTDFSRGWIDGVESARIDIAGPCDERCSTAVADDIERRSSADQLETTVQRSSCNECSYEDYLEVAEFTDAGIIPIEPDGLPQVLGRIDTAFEAMLVVGQPGWAQADGDDWRYVYSGPRSSCSPWVTRWLEVSASVSGQTELVAEYVETIETDKEVCE